MIAPTIYSDVDGKYYGPDKQVHQADGWVNYSTFSLWDTFRAAHPLFTYTEPERVGDMVQSFIAFYEQNGRLPVWNFWGSETDMMIGYHAVPVIVDAYLKGIGNFDPEKALEACVATANIDEYRGIGSYKKNGYIPYNVKDEYNAENWSLSRTLEYAFDDFCIAEMAQKMGKTELANEFYKRSQNYRNVFNPATGFMQPIDDKGVFQPNFNPDEYTAHICESNAWHYFWSVQHDIKGLVSLTGGQDKFAAKLDSMFTYIPAGNEELPIFSTGMIGQYAHGNEPSHHVIYLYNKVRQPWKAQKYAAQVMHELYFNAPAGLCGNEDCGQMSAWYVFSAMGFYPVNPVSGEYEIGTPLFPDPDTESHWNWKPCGHATPHRSAPLYAPLRSPIFWLHWTGCNTTFHSGNRLAGRAGLPHHHPAPAHYCMSGEFRPIVPRSRESYSAKHRKAYRRSGGPAPCRQFAH